MLVGIAEPKINQLQIVLVVEQQILWLEISVNDAQLVQVLDRALDLLEELARLLLGQLLLLDDVVEELAPRNILHDQE